MAVKVLPPKLASKKSHYLARFIREMEISQRVSHPNVARTYDAGEDQGVYYIAMEYIPGMSLTRLVNKSGPLAVERAARLFTEVAAGLEHAHGLNIIHRDLKPSNIMITPNDHAKVLDLGLAMLEGEKDKQPVEVIGGKGYLVGSLDYMAPEQTENSQAVDARADLYALGCSLYFAVTGKAPFAGGDKKDKVHAQRHLEAFPAHHRNPEVPDTFSFLLEKLMAKNPDRRPPDRPGRARGAAGLVPRGIRSAHGRAQRSRLSARPSRISKKPLPAPILATYRSCPRKRLRRSRPAGQRYAAASMWSSVAGCCYPARSGAGCSRRGDRNLASEPPALAGGGTLKYQFCFEQTM